MAETTIIHASVKITPKIRDTYYSFEYSEDRSVNPDDSLADERTKLWDDVFNEVASQINQTIQENQ